MKLPFPRYQGFTLVEVIVVSAVIVLFFSGLLSAVRYVVDLTTNARARLSALTLAHERLEYIRSLPYDSVGTISGIPSGLIAQNSTSTLNNILFNERVLVQYIDDVADGQNAADSNSIVADYKIVKVEYSWNVTGATSSIELMSYIVPRSIETTAGGGTIRVNVFDAYAAPLSGASVRVLNNTTTTTIDVTRSTDAAGVALFAGAPAASNYQIFVTDVGYSTDQTYLATTSNPSPITAPVSVLESDVSTMNFVIDRLSDVVLTTYASIVENVVSETFSASSSLASSSNMAVSGGELGLLQSGGVYAASGSAHLLPVVPVSLERWEVISVVPELPSTTNYLVRLYTVSSSTYTLLPDSALPGNAAGFSSRRIDLRSLNVLTYPSLRVGVTLTTGNTLVTPTIKELSVWFRESSSPRPSVGYTLVGAKLISNDPVYKTTLGGSTNVSGIATLNDIEWDNYSVTLGSGYTPSYACPGLPLVVLPDANIQLELVAKIASTNNLSAQVIDSGGAPIAGASVNLTRSGVDFTEVSNSCGQVFFSDASLGNETDYEVAVTAAGYTTNTLTNLSLGGDTLMSITLLE